MVRAVLQITKTDRWLKLIVAAAAFTVILLAVEASIAYYENQRRISDNEQTALALCVAAGGARDFWIKVRKSTLTILTDKTLSALERKSNMQFVKALDEVIAAANDVAHRCDE